VRLIVEPTRPVNSAGIRAICDDIPNGIVYEAVGRPPDTAIRFTYVSAGVKRLFGIEPADVLADPSAYLVTILDEDLPKLVAEAERSARTSTPMDCQFRQRAKDGRVLWVHLQATPHAVDDGSLLWNGVVLNVTERVLTKLRLAESENRFRAFMDRSPALAWMKDAEGRYVYLNRSCQKRFGIRAEDWIGKTDFDLWPVDVASQFRRNDLAALAGLNQAEMMEVSKAPDGSETRWSVFKFPFTDLTGKQFVGGISVEVTERERLSAELRQTNEELRAALEKAQRLEESLVTMCAWTRRVQMDGRWVAVEEFLLKKLGIKVSHGISEEAALGMTVERQVSSG
jgi:PAS domain S-box-containing protein